MGSSVVVAGLAAAFAMSRVPASPMFGVRPSDPAIVSVVAQIGVAALIAFYTPARRVDPMIVLHEEEAIR